jgi:hypothetical protein
MGNSVVRDLRSGEHGQKQMTPQQYRAIEAFQHRGYYGNPGMRGLGQDDGPSSQQVAGAVQGSIQGIAVAANSNLPITTRIGGGLMAAGGDIALIPGGQIPGAIVAAAGALVSLIGGLFKPNLSNIEATHIVDQIQAQYLQPNLDGWRALAPEHKTVSAQAASLALVDYAFGKVQQGCSNPALGSSGQRCISERLVRGGTAPWCPNPGHTGCDWYALFRDPIANDPNVIPDPVPSSTSATSGGSVSGTVDSIGSSVSTALGGISPVWIGVGLIAAALVFLSD